MQLASTPNPAQPIFLVIQLGRVFPRHFLEVRASALSIARSISRSSLLAPELTSPSHGGLWDTLSHAPAGRRQNGFSIPDQAWNPFTNQCASVWRSGCITVSLMNFLGGNMG